MLANPLASLARLAVQACEPSRGWSLACCLVGLCLTASAAAGDAVSPQKQAAAAPSAVTRCNLGRETRPCLPTGGTTLPLSIPSDAVLRIGVGIAGSAWRAGLQEEELTIAFVAGKRRTPLWSQRLTAGPEGWQDIEVSLKAVGGRKGVLELAHRTVRGTAPADGAVRWSTPRLGAAPRADGPSIILLSIDTLRADHLGCYGYGRDTSPTIDRLAREGVLFRKAIATSSWTLPSHASMFTGLYPTRHGATRFGKQLRPDTPTVAELLSQAGYASAGFTGGGFVAASFGFDRGFDRYWSENVPARVSDELAPNVDRTLQWLQTVGDRPFFLFLHTYATHVPYRPPAETNIFAPDYEGPFKTAFTGREKPSYAMGEHDLDSRDIRQLEALYDAGIRHVDNLLAGFVAALAERPGEVCLILTSDHGEEFNEHGHILHSRPKLYDELLHVPLIAWCPSRIAGGRVIEEPVSLVDLMPTLMELADLPAPAGIDGISLVPALAGRDQRFRAATVSEVSRALIKEPGVLRAIRTEREKLIVSDADGTTLLFDLADDPGETRDVGALRPQDAARLSQTLRATVDDTPRPKAVAAQPDPATLERLRSLGYGP